MRIYCHCNRCNKKIYLASQSKNRVQLANSWGRSFRIKCDVCASISLIDVNLVSAEITKHNAPFMRTLGGGVLGVLAGPLGIAIGLATGRVSGGVVRENDVQDVKRFNNHFI